MNKIPVNFDYVQYSRLDGRPYFQDPKYPLMIQFVVNGEWVSIHVLCIKEEIMDENIKKIVEEAKRLLPQDKSVTETPNASQRPTLPPLQSYDANMTLEALHYKTVAEYTKSQRQLLPASKSDSSSSPWRHSYSQASRAETQLGQAATGSHHQRPDYYSMPNDILAQYGRLQAAPIVNNRNFSH